MTFTAKKLVSLLLLIAALILPLGSLAQAFAHYQPAEDCVCALVSDASAQGERGQQPAPATDNGCGDCGEGEESGSELAEVRPAQTSFLNLSAAQRYLNSPHGFVPNVYLSIFVPPES